MKIVKVITWIGLTAMVVVLLNGFVNGNFRQDGSELLSNPWGIVSLVDLYVGFIIFSMWIVFREKNMIVSFVWIAFLFLRLIIQIFLYQSGEANQLTWVNTLLGWPVTIIVLVLSYIYGIWRLQNLNGPGVQEYQKGKEPPWDGQKRGF
ncbi:MAG: DUF1475 family protein [Bacillota bacterium]